ncbi:MAG: hypothetical protein EAZ97_04970 [Bacteroidetes bacterium]|nr:MAG: hypothetical protein EAZ97_04970 [Bacteroidota bacterium]
MKKNLILFLLLFFSCENPKQTQKEFEWLYAQYSEALIKNENMVLFWKKHTEFGMFPEDINILKRMEFLIEQRRNALRKLDLKKPNFVANQSLLDAYSQFLFNYHKDTFSIQEIKEKHQIYSQMLIENPNQKNTLFCLLNLATLEHLILEKIFEKMSIENAILVKNKNYKADTIGEIGKNWNLLIRCLESEDSLEKIKTNIYLNNQAIKIDVQKCIFRKNYAIYFSFIPPKEGKYRFTVHHLYDVISKQKRDFEYEFVVRNPKL